MYSRFVSTFTGHPVYTGYLGASQIAAFRKSAHNTKKY